MTLFISAVMHAVNKVLSCCFQDVNLEEQLGTPGFLMGFERQILYLQELSSLFISHAFRSWKGESVSIEMHSLLEEGTL